MKIFFFFSYSYIEKINAKERLYSHTNERHEFIINTVIKKKKWQKRKIRSRADEGGLKRDRNDAKGESKCSALWFYFQTNDTL